MKMRTNGEYYALIQFIGRDVKVEVKQIKNHKDINGIQGTWWIGKIDDKQIINELNHTSVKRKTKAECIKELTDILCDAYLRSASKELKRAFGSD